MQEVNPTDHTERGPADLDLDRPIQRRSEGRVVCELDGTPSG